MNLLVRLPALKTRTSPSALGCGCACIKTVSWKLTVTAMVIGRPAGSFLREQPGTHGSAPILRIGAPLPGHSLEKLSAVLMASAPFAPARCAKPCLKCRLRLKSTEKPDGKCEDFSRWWSGERRRDGVNGDNAALRQNRYTFYGNYAIL